MSQVILEEFYVVKYRTITREPTDLSYLGDHWDDVIMGPWIEVGGFDRPRGIDKYWTLVDEGYDVRIKHVQFIKHEATIPVGRPR